MRLVVRLLRAGDPATPPAPPLSAVFATDQLADGAADSGSDDDVALRRRVLQLRFTTSEQVRASVLSDVLEERRVRLVVRLLRRPEAGPVEVSNADADEQAEQARA